ncbi:hypothetical protein B0H14DRAFT_3643623 [Mycena olivaceomarginata]|nr:hypothetical protein B0H14DRAFT_3643623 [Mycena olivaceomarginata]
MASPEARIPWHRKSKALAEARSAFTVNPDFGYLNSQVPDKNAFRHFVGGPAGDETQLELQELSQPTAAPWIGVSGTDPLLADTKPASVKIEKENVLPMGNFRLTFPKYIAELYTAVPTVSPATPGRLKQPRVDVDAVKGEVSVPVVGELSSSATLRIAQLENEMALLRAQLHTKQEATDKFIQGLQRDWDDLRRTCISFQNRVGGFGVRLNRVEGHIDEVVEPRGWHVRN